MKTSVLWAVWMAALALPAAAEPYAVGSQVAAFSAVDQHGADHRFGSNTKFLLVSFDMETGKAANGALDALGAAYLPAHNAVFIANIYGMPGIGRIFAIPAMKKYSHRIVLADDADLLTPYPRRDGKVTVLGVDSSGRITKIAYWTPGEGDLNGILR